MFMESWADTDALCAGVMVLTALASEEFLFLVQVFSGSKELKARENVSKSIWATPAVYKQTRAAIVSIWYIVYIRW